MLGGGVTFLATVTSAYPTETNVTQAGSHPKAGQFQETDGLCLLPVLPQLHCQASWCPE